MRDLFRNPPDLAKQLENLLAQVPAGRVTTYGALAEALGNVIAARWVAQYVSQEELRLPGAHRVIRADGLVGELAGAPAGDKARRLAAEGIEVRQGRADVERLLFDRFRGSRPLAKLARLQEQVVRRVSLRGPRKLPELVAGVDVSYPASDQGVAAYALVEVQSGRLVWSTTLRRTVRFPYITSYLAFREMPVLLDVLDAARTARRLAKVVLVDGSGILHQRHAGIASSLGVTAGVATIGVTKTLLCGQVDLVGMEPLESRPVVHEGRRIGAALRATARSRRPIFLSPGHRVSLDFAETLVRRLLCGHRLPEPLYWADRLSRGACSPGGA
jgi:deoxyribonuclease V